MVLLNIFFHAALTDPAEQCTKKTSEVKSLFLVQYVTEKLIIIKCIALSDLV